MLGRDPWGSAVPALAFLGPHGGEGQQESSQGLPLPFSVSGGTRSGLQPSWPAGREGWNPREPSVPEADPSRLWAWESSGTLRAP